MLVVVVDSRERGDREREYIEPKGDEGVSDQPKYHHCHLHSCFS